MTKNRLLDWNPDEELERAEDEGWKERKEEERWRERRKDGWKGEINGAEKEG